MQKIAVPLPDARWLSDHFRDYANPRVKMASLEGKRELIRLKRGLYVTSDALERNNLPLGCIANRLYGPSYVSFAYALELYGLIPEHVPHVTSATCNKRHTRRFDTPICTFFYRDIPVEAFHRDVVFREESNARYLIASPEKALCDELSTISSIRSLRSIEALLTEDLRIDGDELRKIEASAVAELAPYYRSATVESFSRYLTKRFS